MWNTFSFIYFYTRALFGCIQMLFVQQIPLGQPHYYSTDIWAATGIDSNVNPYISYLLIVTRTHQMQMDETEMCGLTWITD